MTEVARPTCGDCHICWPLTQRLLRGPEPRPSILSGAPRPTVAGLERHAARFGPEQVAETAGEYGLVVDLSGAAKPLRRRRRR